MSKYVFMIATAIALLSTLQAGAEEVATIECTFTNEGTMLHNDGTKFTRVLVIDPDKGWDVTSGIFLRTGKNKNSQRVMVAISRWTGAAYYTVVGVGSINGTCKNTKEGRRDRQLF